MENRFRFPNAMLSAVGFGLPLNDEGPPNSSPKVRYQHWLSALPQQVRLQQEHTDAC